MSNQGSRYWLTVCICCFGALTPVSAQTRNETKQVKKYKFYDVGLVNAVNTVFYNFDAVSFTPKVLNRAGVLTGTYVDSANDAFPYVWSNGKAETLQQFPNAGAYGGGSNTTGINDWGLIVGAADDGELNPLNNQPYDHAAFWIDGKIHRLPELEGHASWANFVTNQGLVVGYAYNSIPDAYTYAGTQTRATLWFDDQIFDLGTLGGTDSYCLTANERGDAIGASYLNTPPGPPFGIPQTEAFLWSNGSLTDLGSLGGAYSTPSAINRKGAVSVISFDATNLHFQSFVYQNGWRTTLKQLGGNFVEAVALNDRGFVAGAVSDPDDITSLAAVWTPSGDGLEIGTIDSDTGSIALGINKHGVVVGGSGIVNFSSLAQYTHAFISQKPGTMQDLNTLIPANASLTLNVAYAINDEGTIAGYGTNSVNEMHAFVLVPDETDNDDWFATAAATPAAPGSSIRMASPAQLLRPPKH